MKEGKRKKLFMKQSSSRIPFWRNGRRIRRGKIVCYIFSLSYRCHCLFMSCLFYVFFFVYLFLLIWKRKELMNFFFNDSIVWIYSLVVSIVSMRIFLYRYILCRFFFNILYSKTMMLLRTVIFLSFKQAASGFVFKCHAKCREKKLILVFFFGN